MAAEFRTGTFRGNGRGTLPMTGVGTPPQRVDKGSPKQSLRTVGLSVEGVPGSRLCSQAIRNGDGSQETVHGVTPARSMSVSVANLTGEPITLGRIWNEDVPRSRPSPSISCFRYRVAIPRSVGISAVTSVDQSLARASP